jgi:Carboxypeptidase regulatory-like domain
MNLRRLATSVLLIALGLASGQSQILSLQGFVFDSHHRPLEGAAVSAGASGKAPALTDGNGHFYVEILPDAKAPITLRVQKDGFTPWSQHLGLSGVAVVVTLTPSNPKPGPSSSTIGTPSGNAAQRSGPPLWASSEDATIDSVQVRLNALGRDATDAQITGVLRGLFDAPVFSYLGEELPEDALYRFCRTAMILMYYGPGFDAPTERAVASKAAQNLIYLQDIFGDLYGPAFSAKEHCDRFGGQTRKEFKAHLGPRLKERSSLDGQQAERVMNSMLTSLAAVGLASRSNPMPQTEPVSDPSATDGSKPVEPGTSRQSLSDLYPHPAPIKPKAIPPDRLLAAAPFRTRLDDCVQSTCDVTLVLRGYDSHRRLRYEARETSTGWRIGEFHTTKFNTFDTLYFYANESVHFQLYCKAGNGMILAGEEEDLKWNEYHEGNEFKNYAAWLSCGNDAFKASVGIGVDVASDRVNEPPVRTDAGPPQ